MGNGLTLDAYGRSGALLGHHAALLAGWKWRWLLKLGTGRMAALVSIGYSG